MPALAVFKQLGLFVLPSFLSSECAAEFCQRMAVAPAKKALVVGRDGEGRLDLDYRKVDSSVLPEEFTAPLRDRLCKLIPALEKHFDVKLAGCDGPVYLVYYPGDFFRPHVDNGAPEGTETRRRRVSVVIFLNRASVSPVEGTYGGGNLNFYGLLDGPQWEHCALPLDAEPGALVAFPSNKRHEVEPVTHGRRFTAVAWFYGAEDSA